VEHLDSGMRRNDEIMFRVEHLDSGIRRNDEIMFTEADGVLLRQISSSEIWINASSMHSSSVRRSTAEVLKPNIVPCSKRYCYGRWGKASLKHSQACPTSDRMRISIG
jgi:hypothetical protein